MKRLGSALSVMFLASLTAARAQVFHVKPVAPHDFAIMAWGSSPSDPTQLYRMKEAGLNISGFCNVKDLAKVEAAGLSCFVTDSRVNGYDWAHLPSNKILEKQIGALIKKIGRSRAVLGFFLEDEPRPPAFHGLGEVTSILGQAAPGKLAYVNLLPNYSPTDFLQTTDYDAYLLEYLDQVRPSLLSYDNYSLFDGKMLDRFYTNLETIRSRSLAENIPFWNVVLSSTFFGYMAPSEATLRLQVYSTLASGARGIEYFTYFAQTTGNFRSAPVDQFGHRTPTWDAIRRVNEQVNALAPWLARLQSTGVYFSPPVPAGLKPISESSLVGSILSEDTRNPPAIGTYLVGEFKSKDGKPFVMIVNRDLEHSIRYLIRLKDKTLRLTFISPYSGKAEDFRPHMDWLAPGGGALFRLDKK